MTDNTSKTVEIVSVNVSPIVEVQYRGNTVPTGIFKVPISHQVLVSKAGLEGDEQADLRVHGGINKAVYIYCSTGYEYWSAELGRPLPPGSFGDNLTLSGISEDDIRIGDLLVAGDLILQVSESRISCFKLGMKMGMPNFSKAFLQAGRVGFYTRVIRDGLVKAGDTFVHQPVQDPSPTIREFNRCIFEADVSRDELRFARNAPGLSPEWRMQFAKRSSSLLLSKSDGGWPDTKPFIVTGKRLECEGVLSFYLSPADEEELPEYFPGQYISVGCEIAGYGHVARTYSLSSLSAINNSFRITVKRNVSTAGIGSMSNHLHDSVLEGHVLHVKAPRGRFFVDRDDTTPLLLIAGGVGITPLLAMLESAVVSGRVATLIFASSEEETRPFRAVIEDYCSKHENITSLFLVSRATPLSEKSQSKPGRIDAGILGDVNLASQIYVCGPTEFVSAAIEALRERGVTPDSVFFETFGSDGKTQRTGELIEIDRSEVHKVRFRRSGFEANWDASAGTLLDLAEANGLRPPFGCRAGTCGECATTVISGDLRYLNLVDPPSNQALVCSCIPTSAVELDL